MPLQRCQMIETAAIGADTAAAQASLCAVRCATLTNTIMPPVTLHSLRGRTHPHAPHPPTAASRAPVRNPPLCVRR